MNSMAEMSCPICFSHNIVFVQKYIHHHELFSKCTIVRCADCEMIFADPMPDEAALSQYNAGYFDNAHGGINENKLTIAFHSAINLLRVLYVETFKNTQQRQLKSVLEVGPGGGHFIRHWLSRNPETDNYSVIESDISCHTNLAKLGVCVYSNIDELPKTKSFDLVVISHVLEHTSHPGRFIDECTRLLSPGGILFVEVPCMDHQHKDVMEPHLLFFDKPSIKLLLTSHDFRVEKLSYHGNTITDLKRPISFFKKWYSKGRNFLLRKGVLFPFSVIESGLESISDPLERACVKPFKAHIEQKEPSWWLRAIAVKK